MDKKAVLDKKIIGVAVVVAVLFGGAGFFGGTQYAKATARNRTATMFQGGQFGGGGANGGNRTGARQGAAGGFQRGAAGFVNGEVIAKDDKSITVQMMDKSTKIIFLSSSTTIGKTTAGSAADLTSGTYVTVTGSTDSSGTVTAQTIQIRPEGVMMGVRGSTSTTK